MLYLNNRLINFGKFPNGETYADISKSAPYNRMSFDPNVITLKFENDLDIFHLQCLKDYVDNCCPNVPCVLDMPYIPYSRMDRQEEDRLFTLKSFAKIINNMNFSKVVVMEPHSEVSVALIDRVQVINKSAELVYNVIMDILNLKDTAWLKPKFGTSESEDNICLEGLLEKAKQEGIYLVYPDAGAEKRYRKQIKYNKVITCSKDRDFNTGKINSIVINSSGDFTDCNYAIIVDDLSSKGGTFIGTAKALRDKISTVKEVILVVTHCENTILEGEVLTGESITRVFTTDSIFTGHQQDSCESSNHVAQQNKTILFNKMVIEKV